MDSSKRRLDSQDCASALACAKRSKRSIGAIPLCTLLSSAQMGAHLHPRPEAHRFALARLAQQPVVLVQQVLRVSRDQRVERRPAAVGAVIAVEFDSMGALVACGAQDGGLCVFSFESSRKRAAKVQNKRHAVAQGKRRSDKREDDTEEDAREWDWEWAKKEVKAKKQPPLIRVDTMRTIRAMAWCKEDEDRLACGYSAEGKLSLFNVATVQKSRPFMEIGIGQRGTTALKFGTDRNSLFAGTGLDTVQSWDLRLPMRAKWEVFATPTGQKALGLSSQGVSSILFPDDTRIMASSTNGFMTMWDVRNLKAPLFSNRPAPTQILSTSIGRSTIGLDQQDVPINKTIRKIDGIVSMKQSNHSTDEVYFQLQSGVVGLYDIRRQKVITKTTIQLLKQSQRGHLFTNVEQDENAENSRQVIPARRNCLAALPQSDIVCSGVPGNPSVYLIDLSPSRAKVHDEWTTRTANRIPLSSPVSAIAAHPYANAIVVAEEKSSTLTFLE